MIMHPTLAQTAFPRHTLARDVALVLGGSLLIALGARLEVPLPWTPVPITLQTLFVLLVGAALGPRLGALAALAYLAEGAAGLPFFSGGAAGAAKLFGATGGYLLSFPVMAALVGALVQRAAVDRRLHTAALAMLLATFVNYLMGVTWLGVALPGHQSVAALLNMGAWPFIAGDALKAGLVALLLPATWAMLKK
ncbi:biotin transporter BioY [Deinococcus maricopensis]|uniref:Biotin transporter n=1 Tax=Deinococcus maricopensis (strain DSM 21211 / LMG 22137 / NRRL B-23946 / LB-34) TaxID=709986 RepID=E8U3Y4_DEIML|nr:biotin transporter BioY [Deinococcus maricopensis]ADV65678.1 BioY protein [Deinococcus maricopensis DSM 21211]